ncbi:hypothetical protein LTR09_007012 [Extremus antarcticus]|uniref:Telomeric repeat-binding factor 2-interacting protein 1 n=1 Tax=Extremus antarcticus TaxID=702011 RepID=A0AAJ0DK44_9PEZI|nr:hypothetical protein LTR09_007012 [Extremus antarcticus]
MANAQAVVNNANDATPAVGGLFGGLGFFVLQRVWQRGLFVQKIQANGGRVVKTEAQADHVIADHYRQDCPPGSISYRFIEQALQDGELPDPADHMAGPPPGTARPVGSVVPGRRTRTEFTSADDRVLWQWVERTRAAGGPVKGLEIYKQLEAVNPRHTYQAWRDRYMKKLMVHPPAGVNVTVPANPPPSPPEAPDQEDGIQAGPSTDREPDGQAEEDAEMGNTELNGTAEDVKVLLGEAEDIERIVEDQIDEAWEAFANEYGTHSAEAWRQIWQDKVRPIYLQQQHQQDQAQQQDSSDLSSAVSENESVANEDEDATNENADAVEDQGDARIETEGVAIKDEVTAVNIANTADSLRTSSQERKRGLDERLSRMLRKKQRTDRNEEPPIVSLISSDEDSVEEASTEHVVVTNARADPAAVRQVDVGSQRFAEVTIPTSDLNREAQTQLQEEASGYADPENDVDHLPPDDIQMPDISSEVRITGRTPSASRSVSDRDEMGQPLSSPASRGKSTPSRPWTDDEDQMLLRGIQQGWTMPRTINKYKLKRSESGARYRKAQLASRYPGGIIPTFNVRYELTQIELANGMAINAATSGTPGDRSTEVEMSLARFDEEVFERMEPQVDAHHEPIREDQQSDTVAHMGPIDHTSVTAPPTAAFDDTASPPTSPFCRWTVDEDKGLLRGTRDGWKTPRTLAEYRINRSNSAARNRKKELVNMYPRGIVPIHDVRHEPSQIKSANWGITNTVASPIRNRRLVEAVAIPQAVSDGSLVSQAAENVDRLLRSDLPTSDINRAAEQQIQRELRNQESEIEALETIHAVISSPHAQQRGTTTSSLEQPAGSGQNALTEANLASQQAMHRDRLLRGTDLPPDEDDVQAGQTQEDFAAYLKSPADVQADLQHQAPLASGRLLGVDDVDQLPLSAQAEIEGTMDDLIHWPDSPPRSQLNDTSLIALKASQIETQVAYPLLPPATNHDRQNPSSPPFGLNPTYPYLPGASPSPLVAKSIEAEEHSATSPPGSSSSSHERDAHPTYQAAQDKAASVQFSQNDEDEEDEDELELSVPMPEGGWNVSSPVAKPPGSRHRQISKGEESLEPATEQRHVEIISSGSSSSSASDDSLSEEATTSTKQGQAVETQDIVNAETQPPDLTMPLPPDSDSDADSEDLPSNPLIPRSSPPNPANLLESQKNLAHLQQLPDENFDEYFQTMVVRGYKAESIIEALQRTSFRTELADFVLLEEKAGKGLPRDIAGVWSEEEDALAEGGVASALRKLEDKHTWFEVEERLRYLTEWREADEAE